MLPSSHVVLLALVATIALHAGTPAAADPADEREFRPAALWDGRKIVPFKALDDPKLVKAADADFMADGDYVLGLTLNGESRAYPSRFIWWHHVVNDTLAGRPVAITYCSVCNTGIAYDRKLGGKEIKLDFFGLYYGVVCFCDRETESVIPQVSGRALNGPLANQELKPLPVLDTTWGEWKKLHPDTRVMQPQEEFKRYYRPSDNPEPRGYDKFPAPFFRPTVIRGDKRLPPFDKVLGVVLRPAREGEVELRRAYPIAALRDAGGAVNDVLGTLPIAVLLDPATVTAAAVSRVLDGRTLTFEGRKQADGSVALFDKETGTRWSVEGKGLEGDLAGKSLMRVDCHLSQWYGWSAFFPSTTVYGRTDPPQPGNPFEEPK